MLRLAICYNIFGSYTEDMAVHDDYNENFAADLDAWLASMRMYLDRCIPGAGWDQVCAKTREFANQSGQPVSMDSIFFAFVSSLQPYLNLSSLLEYIMKMLASGVTAFVTRIFVSEAYGLHIDVLEELRSDDLTTTFIVH